MRLSDIARVTGGALRGPDVPVSRVVVHSSRAGAGAVFVALRGHRTDGHRFVAEAHRRGATAALVERDLGWDCSLAVVSCTGDALLALAAFEREELGPTVVAVTGSTGKTTTKDMSARILRTNFVTHASPASFNNQVGVPLTILGAMVGTEVLVCEVGAGVVGEIASLCRVARPRIGVVTNVGLAHVETFGSPQNVARAKAELPESLPRNGVAVLNADDPIVASYAGRTPARVVTFGRSARAEVRATGVALDELARPRFTIEANGARADVVLRVIGEHMVENALAAAACALALGVRVEQCARGLESYSGRRSRMELRRSPDGLLVLDDSYNASPHSMQAALRTARHIAAGRRAVAVLGPMVELGEFARSAHEDVGRLVVALGFDLVITVGDEARAIAWAARQAGMCASAVVDVAELDEAVGAVRRRARPGDVVLVKGSRAAGLDCVTDALAQPGDSTRRRSQHDPRMTSGNPTGSGTVKCADEPNLEG